MSERKMATIRKVAELLPIENADRLELAIVDGWQAVVQKGIHKVGDLVVYLEIDSFCPVDKSYFQFLKPRAITWQGKRGARIRTMKLRGCLSQGLVIPLSEVIDDIGLDYKCKAFIVKDEDRHFPKSEEYEPAKTLFLGDDVTTALGVDKWEKPVPAQLQGRVKGNFPSFIPKTDQERIQNIWGNLVKRRQDKPWETFEVTEKLEGSSMTTYIVKVEDDGMPADDVYRFGVCSRNWDLDETEDNAFWKAARFGNIQETMDATSQRDVGQFAIQGELIGEGVQGNHYGLKEPELYVFDIYMIKDDIRTKGYMIAPERRGLTTLMELKHVPLLEGAKKFDFDTLEDALKYAEGKSVINPKVEREGVVFKSNNDPNFTFKIISNKYLLEEK